MAVPASASRLTAIEPPDAKAAGYAAQSPTGAPVTFEQFMDLCDEDRHAELVGGRVVDMSPAADVHQFLLQFLSAAIGEFVQEHDLGSLILAPFAMRLGDGTTVREPDLLFVAKANLARWHRTYLDGPADLAVEITSPESLTRDRGEKYFEYEQAGVAEYWLIDPERKQAEFYQLGPDRMYRHAAIDADAVYQSRVLAGLWLRIDWLWCQPHPRVLDVLREWGLL